MADLPALAVVIPTYRRPELLEQCIEGLRGQDVAASDFEVVVVDDASGPDTVAVLQRAAASTPNLRWASQPRNRGPAAARNRAVAMSSAPLLLFLDDDIVASPSLVRTHLELHTGMPETYGVVGHVEWLPSLHVTGFMRWLDGVPLQFAFAQMTEGKQADPSGAFYTCNVSITRRLFDAAGGFDERFPFAAYEDKEFALRLIERGFELDYRRAPLAWNSRPITLEQFCARMKLAAQSALVFEEARGVSEVIPELSQAKYSDLQLLALRVAAAVAPSLRGHNVRSAYYWERVRRAYRDGLAAGRPTSK